MNEIQKALIAIEKRLTEIINIRQEIVAKSKLTQSWHDEPEVYIAKIKILRSAHKHIENAIKELDQLETKED